ncbi:MAG: FKBP-type peptidyl-prolyl cis-trans isomerase [Flavobacteriales bacterium]
MRRPFVCVYLAGLMLLAACDAEGVREQEKEKEVVKTVNNDTVKPIVIDSAYLVKDNGKYAPEKINYDTAFRFCEIKSTETRKTASGIKIEMLKTMPGEKLKKGEVVSLIYRGKLKDGKTIETTQAFGKPLPFYIGIGMTFETFDEVLLQCRNGEKIRFTIPSASAYGKKGHGKLIPPDSDLIYEMHIAGPTRPIEPEKGIRLYHIIDKPLARQVSYDDKLLVGYMGWTEKGKLFDASVFHGKDSEVDLGVGNTIKGWKFSLVQMREGEKALVFLPSSMGYGSKGIPEMVPPNSNLIYILEVKQIN